MRTKVGTDGLFVDGAPGDNITVSRMFPIGRRLESVEVRVERADLPDLIAALQARVQISQSAAPSTQDGAENVSAPALAIR